MWLARDKDEELYLFSEKPSKREEFWLMSSATTTVIQLPSELFPEVKWEDEEPKEIVLKNDVEKQDNLDIPEEDDYCKYHFMILKKNSDGKLFCNDCLTNCIHRKTGTYNYLIKKNSK